MYFHAKQSQITFIRFETVSTGINPKHATLQVRTRLKNLGLDKFLVGDHYPEKVGTGCSVLSLALSKDIFEPDGVRLRNDATYHFPKLD